MSESRTRIVATKLVLTASNIEMTIATSAMFDMLPGANAIQVTVTGFAFEGNGTLSITLELSNDGQNWTSNNSFDVTGVGVFGEATSDIAAKWWRLQYVLTAETEDPVTVILGVTAVESKQ